MKKALEKEKERIRLDMIKEAIRSILADYFRDQ